MQEMSKNTFDLTNPDDYNCAMLGCRHNHSMMLVRVSNGEIDSNAFFIVFSEVIYYEGPFQWNGCNFYLASEDECKELLTYLGHPVDFQIHFHLFILEKVSGPTVKILAARVEKIPSIPETFKWLNEPL